LLNSILDYRFLKFGCVGVLGTIVSLVMLYAGQEYLFLSITSEDARLYLSLGFAVFVATGHNYLWNRHWTWAERKDSSRGGFFSQMYKYYLSCSLAIFVQYSITAFMAHWMYYMYANLVSVCFAALVTYLVNDVWTFTRKSRGEQACKASENDSRW
jgi:putative flippase GtrA